MTIATALVTGANKGIGRHIAWQLAAAGVTVYVGSRDADRGRAVVSEIGDGARLLVLDVTDDASIATAASQVGELDILVNNVGIGDDPRTAPDADVESFRRMYETNVFGVVAVTNAFLPALRKSPRPRIVNILQRHRVARAEHQPEPAVRVRRRQRRGVPLVENRA